MGDLAEAAFRDRYRDVVRFLRRRTGSDERAEELAQAVFVDAVVGLRDFEPGRTPVLAWLYTVARRRLADEARRRVRHGQPFKRADPSQTHVLAAYGPELARVLAGVLRELPEENRRVVVMRLLEGRRFAEIASQLGVSEAACKMRFARGLRFVRERLMEEGVSP